MVVALVPAFNEERLVASVLVRLMKAVGRVIVCDDGGHSRLFSASSLYRGLIL